MSVNYLVTVKMGIAKILLVQQVVIVIQALKKTLMQHRAKVLCFYFIFL